MNNNAKDDKWRQACILSDWRGKINKLKETIPQLSPRCLDGVKLKEIIQDSNKTIKEFLQMYEGDNLALLREWEPIKLAQVHLRLQFVFDLFTSYLAQLAFGAPDDYKGEIKTGEFYPCLPAYYAAIKRMMLEVWERRSSEWLLAATAQPLTGGHCLNEVFDDAMAVFVEAEIQDLLYFE